MTDANRPILIATSNAGKIREMTAIFAGLPIELIPLDHFPGVPIPEEDGITFEINAEKKALHYARITRHWSLADDSGLVVDALNGEPGVHSARYAGSECDDAANNALLIRNLRDVPDEKRTARFQCAAALSDGENILATTSGVVEGMVVDDPRGSSGFGYDPHFFVPEFGMTTAQMSPELKNRISHRGKAMREMRGHLEKLLGLLMDCGE